ncbi:Ankyrin repeat domain-containing protein, chloroplastic [Linum perenne]
MKMAALRAPPNLPSPLPFPVPLNFSSIRTIKFPRSFCSFSSSFQSSPIVTDDDHAIGDCLVFEEGIFEDPYLDAESSVPDSPPPEKISRGKKKMQAAEIRAENLVPDEWIEAQAEMNITKKERRRIAQEMQQNSRLERRTRGLVPIRNVDLEEYEAFREAKRTQLKPLVQTDDDEEEDEEGSDEEGFYDSDEEENGFCNRKIERVAPKNPRWAVYGKGFEYVNEFFRSGKYNPGDKDSEGRRKLFTKEEKVFLNRRIPDVSVATCVKWQPLHTLAASGEFYLMNILLKHNLDINSVDAGLSALHKAIIGKKQAIISYLLRESANPFIRDADGATLMHYAVRTASVPAIKLLLLYNVDINLQDNDGWSPLHLAVQALRTDVVKLLLIKGADKTLTNKDGLTPLELCLHLGRNPRTYELIKMLKLYPRKSTAAAAAAALARKRSSGLTQSVPQDSRYLLSPSSNSG